MYPVNEFCVKGGGRNRARRARRAERHARRYPAIESAPEPVVDLSGVWNPEVALKRLDESGQSQRAFAGAHGFPVSRIATWRRRLAV